MKKKSIQDLKGKALDSQKLKKVTGGQLEPGDLPISGGCGAVCTYDLVMM